MVELGNGSLYPWSGTPHGDASELGCRCLYLPATSCLLQGTYPQLSETSPSCCPGDCSHLHGESCTNRRLDNDLAD